MGLFDSVFLRDADDFPKIWMKQALIFALFISISLILAYNNYHQLPDAKITPLEVYGAVILFALSGICLHFLAGPKGEYDTSRTLFGRVMILMWLFSIFYVVALELIFAVSFLKHPESPLTFLLALVSFFAPFVWFFLNKKR